jgi:hypothetical protein
MTFKKKFVRLWRHLLRVPAIATPAGAWLLRTLAKRPSTRGDAWMGHHKREGADRGFRKAIVCRAIRPERWRSQGNLEIVLPMAKANLLALCLPQAAI